jgi:radical SAM superfamily enzyme YgiQ (UPF0313 family)
MRYDVVIIDPSSLEVVRSSFCYLPYLLFSYFKSRGKDVLLLEDYSCADIGELPDAEKYLVGLWSYPQVDACLVLDKILPKPAKFFGYEPLVESLRLPKFIPSNDMIYEGLENCVRYYDQFKYLLLSDSDMHMAKYSGLVYPLFTSYGCVNKCLTGDTIIHTVDGDFPIQSLSGKKGVKVLSCNLETYELFYTDVRNIRKTANNSGIVRVHFDDGSHIDCTPDHKFKVFKNTNQHTKNSCEKDVEANDLLPGQSVRAVGYARSPNGRTYLRGNRYLGMARSVLVMESILGRKLITDEVVHHKDGKPGNDFPSNLILTDKRNHIPDYHPEIAERMKRDNPAKNMTLEWREKIRTGNTGKVRSEESKLRYRQSRLGDKNPNWKGGKYAENHRVSKIEHLPHKEDVYCMEVPTTEWFYANKVLVHNCKFCPVAVNCKGDRVVLPVERVCEILDYCEAEGMKNIHFADEDFFFDTKRAEEILNHTRGKGFQYIALGTAGMVLKFVEDVGADFLQETGMKVIEIGLESADLSLNKKMGKVGKGGSNRYEVLAEAVKGKVDIFWLTMTFFPGETITSQRATGLFLEKYGAKFGEMYPRIQTNSSVGGLGQFFQAYAGTWDKEDLEEEGMVLSDRPMRLMPSFVPNSFLNSPINKIRPIREDEKVWYRLYKISDDLIDTFFDEIGPVSIGADSGPIYCDVGDIFDMLTLDFPDQDVCFFFALSARLGVIG